jgi:hypothetical protein
MNEAQHMRYQMVDAGLGQSLGCQWLKWAVNTLMIMKLQLQILWNREYRVTPDDKRQATIVRGF